MGWIRQAPSLVLPRGPSICIFVSCKYVGAEFLYINVSKEELESSLREEVQEEPV